MERMTIIAKDVIIIIKNGCKLCSVYSWDLLQDSANIQYGKGYIIQKLGRQFYDEIGLWFMYLLTGKFKMLHNFVGDYVKLLYMLPKINDSRRRNKTLHDLKNHICTCFFQSYYLFIMVNDSFLNQ